MQLMNACMAYVAEAYCSQMLIDSAASLLYACIELNNSFKLVLSVMHMLTTTALEHMMCPQ